MPWHDDCSATCNMLLPPDAECEIDPWGAAESTGRARPSMCTELLPAPQHGVLELLLAVLTD